MFSQRGNIKEFGNLVQSNCPESGSLVKAPLTNGKPTCDLKNGILDFKEKDLLKKGGGRMSGEAYSSKRLKKAFPSHHLTETSVSTWTLPLVQSYLTESNVCHTFNIFPVAILIFF